MARRGTRVRSAVVLVVLASAVALAPALTSQASARTATASPAPTPRTATVGAPSWWSGDCDRGHFDAAAAAKGWAGAGAHRLGASYLGVPVCGPRPKSDGSPDILWTRSGWGEYEWECPELAMRFMAQIYGVSAYHANGNTVVSNYTTADGGGLVKVTNGTIGKAPAPGDVMSFDGGSAGHVAVVTASTVDASGNGSIELMTQNDTADGWRTLAVNHWTVAGFGYLTPTAWLHDPLGRGDPSTPPTTAPPPTTTPPTSSPTSTAPAPTVDYTPFSDADSFVAQQLLDLAGSPGTPDSRAAADAALEDGTNTPVDDVQLLLLGTWFGGPTAPVARLYWAYFGRIPDYGGLTYWAGRYRSGTSLNAISQGFARSGEFTGKYGALSDTAFVDLVYQNVLGRAPDSGGASYWVGKLAAGMARGTVMTGFSESSEYVTKMTPSVDTVLVAAGLLHRSPTPDELTAAAGLPLRDLVAATLHTPEYATRVTPA